MSLKRSLAAALCGLLLAGTVAASTPDWIERSNQHAQIMLGAMGTLAPEQASFFGVAALDDQTTRLDKEAFERARSVMNKAVADLEAALANEQDPRVRQDIEIMIATAKQQIEGLEINLRLTMPFIDAPQIMFQGIQSLLQEQTAPERRAKALTRLSRYVGLIEGSAALTEEVQARYEEKRSDSALLRPVRNEVEQAKANVPTFKAGIRKLFEEYKIEGSEAALAAMDKQFDAYAAWLDKTVMPEARTDFRLPAELYAFQLKQVGIDIDPQTVIRRAQLEFMETRLAMQALAPMVATKMGIEATDYRDVIRALKARKLEDDKIESYYRGIIEEIDVRIAKAGIVDLPQRPMRMRLASAAESAAQPAPHFLPAPLIGNTGEQGTFVLSLGNPTAGGDAEHYDDFSFEAGAWTLSAHEGRPGHELQFTAMVERGVSLARSLFAFNSVNVEGWALYAEAEMVPHEPIEGQLIALQFRLIRAARAVLDPMLNLGEITREEAERVLIEDVVLSRPMARQELDRYTFRAPGQAASYFYGYTRILELRMATEIALGRNFDRKAFNNFLLDQGLLPPALVEKAVREQFIPAHRKP